MTTPRPPLVRCAECMHNTKPGTWCPTAHRYRRGRIRIRCDSHWPEYPLENYAFGTDHYQETPLADQLMIFDRSGGERLIPWALGHGLDAATALFREWLEDQVGDHLQRQREARMRADINRAAQEVRASFRLVQRDQEPKP